MANQLNENELWELIGFIKISKPRYQTLKTLENGFLMPSEIAQKTNLRDDQISNALHDLKDRNLVVCKNENAKKGRIYESTELGVSVLEIIDNNHK